MRLRVSEVTRVGRDGGLEDEAVERTANVWESDNAGGICLTERCGWHGEMLARSTEQWAVEDDEGELS